MSLLQVAGISKQFGGLAALTNVSLQAQPGERRAIIGPNGAGKTTLFNVITGELSPTGGTVHFDHRDVTALPVHTRANLGMGHTFQRNNLFFGLTVLENVRLAVQHHRGIARQLFRAAVTFEAVTAEAVGLLEQVGLAADKEQLVGTLAYGQQRALEVALALATEPQTLLLDEPTAGMSPAETKDMVQLIDALPRSLTVLIVEHDMDVVVALADRITVLHHGHVVSEGTPEQVRADPTVQEIYLGAESLAV
ncbi:MAG TPA: ABC transporter ATP-binding protein [Anaerolineales bacterium]|jgi:branched-chain amino acid transport system ATP-binding protein|nr:ABC transporter ATP-binding protein [Anaerolineales bacterium]